MMIAKSNILSYIATASLLYLCICRLSTQVVGAFSPVSTNIPISPRFADQRQSRNFPQSAITTLEESVLGKVDLTERWSTGTIENNNGFNSHTTRVPTWLKRNTPSILGALTLIGVSCAFPSPSIATDATVLVGGASSLTTVLEKISETGFYQAFSLVFVSEIGDKTFFIAGLLAMKTGKLLSFVGSVSALAVMTVISVVIGQLFHVVPPGITQGLPIDDIAAVLAFSFFGLKTLKEASELGEDNIGIEEEFADAEEAVEGSDTIKKVTTWGKIASTFGLVFAAEFGDRSFLSTIALSAAQNPVSVGAGAVAAHAIATGIAVAGGSYVAKYISEKTIGYIGGSLFLIFAATTAFGIF